MTINKRLVLTIPIGLFLWILNFYIDDLYHWLTGDYLAVVQRAVSYQLLLRACIGMFSVVLVLLSAIAVIVKERNPSNRSKSAKPTLTDSDKCSKPTPNQILDEIDNQPPLLREAFAKNYIGIKVKWVGSFSNVYDNHNGTVDVGVDSGSTCFYFTVALKDYPIFRTLKPETARLQVTGTIASVDGPVHLENPQFQFLTQSNQK